MTDTDRKLVQQQTSSDFEEEFIDYVYFGCFSHKVYVVIKQRTLYLYDSQSSYQEYPD